MNVTTTAVMNMPGIRVISEPIFFPLRSSHTVAAIRVVAASTWLPQAK